MKQQNKQRYLIRYLSIFAILISFVITKTSCKKTDALSYENQSSNAVISNQFFNFSGNIHPLVKRVAQDLQLQNQKTGFITQLANQAGYPAWDKSTIRVSKSNNTNSNSFLENYEGGDTCILIPMVLQDANHVNAFISAVVDGDSITERLYYRNDYKAYPFQATQTGPTTSANVTTAEEFAIQMMSFDKAVFGYTKFDIKDKKLFLPTQNYKDTSFAKGIATITSTQQNNLIMCEQVEIVITVCNTPTYYACADADGCDICGNGVCYQIISSAESCTNVPTPGGGGWPTAPPPGPGGTGGGSPGGGTGNPNGNCVVGGLIQNGFAPPNPCNPPTGGNPLPPATSQSGEINPTISDDDEEVTWWNDPTTNYPPQSLPSWDSVYAKYPKDSLGRDLPPGDIYRLIGGTPLAIYLNDSIANGNACAARLSRALLYSGITIPSIPNKTFMGSDGKYYFLSAAAMFDWMSKTFGATGSNVITLNTAQGGANGVNFGGFLVGKKGIYIMRPISRNPTTGFGASGHATLYNGTNCIPGSDGHATEYFDAQGGVHTIRLWKLN